MATLMRFDNEQVADVVPPQTVERQLRARIAELEAEIRGIRLQREVFDWARRNGYMKTAIGQ